MPIGHSVINADKPEKQDPDEQEKVKHVYIGVFFDGTSNNMLRAKGKPKSETPKAPKHPFRKIAKSTLLGAYNQVENLAYNLAWNYIEAIKIEHRIVNNALSGDVKAVADDYIKMASEVLKTPEKVLKAPEKVLKAGGEILEDASGTYDIDDVRLLNLKPTIEPTSTAGYSNVVILYSIYNKQKVKADGQNYSEDGDSITHHIYVEGAGATDISRLSSMNVNGLGFGLGTTGVTALVSKAVRYVQTFLDSIQNRFDKNEVTIHFEVFGFSRGSACARLFSHLVTRNKNENTMPRREHEFGKYYAKPMFNGKLHFLDDYPKKQVDFLGIYDTVASIGFLKHTRKNNWEHVLCNAYKWATDYKDNWHYLNVKEYGQYSPKDVKYCCHICAMDEFRENFALTDLGKTVPSNCMEILIPGCHSDVGGGYFDGDSQAEMQLYKYRDTAMMKILRTLTRIPLNPLALLRKPLAKCIGQENHIITDQPQQSGSKKLLNLDTFREDLGWLDKKDKKTRINICGESVPCTLHTVDDAIYFKFKRRAKAGYSNIPLKMMVTAAVNCKCTRLNIGDIPPDYQIPGELQSMGAAMVSHCNTIPRGQREWLFPGGRYDSEVYKNLRLKYLHFTSTTDPLLWHLTARLKPVEGTPGNIANTPNIDENGTFCRIVYHGDKSDTGLYYMWEYGGKAQGI